MVDGGSLEPAMVMVSCTRYESDVSGTSCPNASLVPEAEEPVDEPAPALSTTGLGPEESVPWQAIVLVSLALDLAFWVRRRNAISSE